MIIKIDGNKNILFIGEELEYEALKQELKIFNKENDKLVYTEFFNGQGFQLNKENSLEENIYNIYLSYYHCYEIEARIKSSVYKNIKI